LRQGIAETLDGMANALVESWPPEHRDWFDQVGTLEASIRAAEPVLEEARESRRLNPRARRHEYDLQEDYDDLRALEAIGRHTRDLGETVSAAIWSDPVPVGIPDELREPLSTALSRMADLVRAWDEKAGAAEAVQQAEQSLDDLRAVGQGLGAGGQADGVLGTTAFTLRRMLAVIETRIPPPTA
jgi:hypothetical protein